MFRASDAIAMAGVTQHQLREWTARRCILPADAPGRGRGKHALYSWSTILVLRIMADLHARFHIEVGYWAALAPRLRAEMSERSFVSLYGQVLTIVGFDAYQLLPWRTALLEKAVIWVPLDEHLAALAGDLGLARELTQLPLFPVMRA